MPLPKSEWGTIGGFRVPAVYLASAFLLVLLVLLERGMNNLREIRGRIESESHPLRHSSKAEWQQIESRAYVVRSLGSR
jgi:hypothetical protein